MRTWPHVPLCHAHRLYDDMAANVSNTIVTDVSAPTTRINGEPRPMLDVEALAQRLGVNVRFIRRLVDERRIPFYKVGKLVRFDPDEISRWIAARRVAAD